MDDHRPRYVPNGPTPTGRQMENGERAPGMPGPAILESPTASTMTRAERFEDEKRRIIESCFTKREPNGQLFESYITHIRVQEDAAFPSSPPPPHSSPNNKKPRLVIVAVRSTGRVRMHKARENSNGTFSIGKTWGLEELTAVQSFTNLVPSNPEEDFRKQWAGPTGFIITITKPYYWEAGTAKEKEFFVQSLVKIYRKYTQGGTPQLIGFSPQEQEQLLNLAGQSRGGPNATDSRPPKQVVPAQGQERRPPRTTGLMSPGTDVPSRALPGPAQGPRRPSGTRIRTPGVDEPESSQDSPGSPHVASLDQAQDVARQPRMRPSQEQVIREARDRENVRPYHFQGHSTASSQRLTPQSSHSEIAVARTNSPGQTSVSSKAPSVQSAQLQKSPHESPHEEDGHIGQARPSTNGNALSTSTAERWKPKGAYFVEPAGLPGGTSRTRIPNDNSRPATPKTETLAINAGRASLPERKRPPLSVPDGTHPSDGDSSRDEFTTPLSTSPSRLSQSLDRPPTTQEERAEGSMLQQQRQQDSYFVPASNADAGAESTDITPRAAYTGPETTSDDAGRSTVKATTSLSKETTAPPITPDATSQEDIHRPGLGPMFKKRSQRDVADQLREAATAASAFKPRAGGAAEKLMFNQSKTSNEPDGLSQVVPAPRRGLSVDHVRTASLDSLQEKQPLASQAPLAAQAPLGSQATTLSSHEQILFPVVTSGSETAPEISTAPAVVVFEEHGKTPVPDDIELKSSHRLKPRRERRRSNQQANYLSALDINPELLEGRGLDFEAMLGDFVWMKDLGQVKKVDLVEADIRREIGRVEAGSWLGHLEQKDERVEAVEKMLDKAIAECEELEGLLTLYGVELSTLNEDVAFIEAQSQGLQVHTANQKLLQTDLQQLVDTISITRDQLEPLRRAPIGSTDGLRAIESALLLLYRAMVTIDPTLRQHASVGDADSSTGGLGTSEVANMRALQEKKDTYNMECTLFIERLRGHLDITFGAAFMSAKDALTRSGNSLKASTKFEPGPHDLARALLWRYSPLLLFIRDVDTDAWQSLMKLYQTHAQAVYRNEFRDNILTWKQAARKRLDDAEILFTTHEKESESLASTARKLTVKRSQTLAKTLRTASGDKIGNQDGKAFPYEAFAGALEEMTSLILMEQNFIVDYFHATSNENLDFADAVMAAPPEGRRGTNLHARKLYEPNRSMAKRVCEVMEDLFSFWLSDMQNFVEWTLSSGATQGIGVIAAIERKLAELEETNEDFLTKSLQKLHERLVGLFNRFVDEQIRAIEDTKVKVKKRKGVIGFMRTFPVFSSTIENMLSVTDGVDRLEIRSMIDDAYRKINKAMFESLKVIAKDSPTVAMGPQGAGDPDDKEALNYHILMIDNMNHYIEEVDERPDAVLGEWKGRAMLEMTEHIEAYCSAVIRRPLGKLIDFLDTTDTLLSSLPSSQPPSTLTARSSHSRSTIKKILATHDAKEIAKGIARLKERISKHFGDAADNDNQNLARNLVTKVVRECEGKYLAVWERLRSVVESVYEGGVEVGWGREDVVGAFRK